MALPASGLEAHLLMDAGSGQTVPDLTANNHDAQLGSTGGADTNDPAWAAIDGRSALDPDGIDDFLRVATLNMTGWAGVTFAVLVYLDLDNQGEFDGVIIGRRFSAFMALRHSTASPYPDGRIYLHIRQDDGTQLDSAFTWGAGQQPSVGWHVLSSSYNPATARFNHYLDGVLLQSANIPSFTQVIDSARTDLYIFQSGENANYSPLPLAEAAVWSRPLTDEEQVEVHNTFTSAAATGVDLGELTSSSDSEALAVTVDLGEPLGSTQVEPLTVRAGLDGAASSATVEPLTIAITANLEEPLSDSVVDRLTIPAVVAELGQLASGSAVEPLAVRLALAGPSSPTRVEPLAVGAVALAEPLSASAVDLLIATMLGDVLSPGLLDISIRRSLADRSTIRSLVDDSVSRTIR